MTSALEQEDFNDRQHEVHCGHIDHLTSRYVSAFEQILKSFALFNVVFILLMVAEIGYFFIHLTFLAQSFIIAIHLALIFATFFCYFTIQMYAQTKKTDKFLSLKDQLIHSFRQSLQDPTDRHTPSLVAHACCKLAEALHSIEYRIYSVPSWCSFLSSSFEKINCWWFWQDAHQMKEILLQASIEEHLKFVRMEPTNLEAHAGLANAYVMMSGLYVDPRTIEGLDDERWIPPNKFNKDFKQKFRMVAERAIEEFRILNDYAPDDPWVHVQLAYSYRDLQMPLEEIKQYEIVLELCPDDKETLMKLGKLYFEQGQNGKGLEIYETLKRAGYKKADTLLRYYGAYSHAIESQNDASKALSLEQPAFPQIKS